MWVETGPADAARRCGVTRGDPRGAQGEPVLHRRASQGACAVAPAGDPGRQSAGAALDARASVAGASSAVAMPHQPLPHEPTLTAAPWGRRAMTLALTSGSSRTSICWAVYATVGNCGTSAVSSGRHPAPSDNRAARVNRTRWRGRIPHLCFGNTVNLNGHAGPHGPQGPGCKPQKGHSLGGGGLGGG